MDSYDEAMADRTALKRAQEEDERIENCKRLAAKIAVDVATLRDEIPARVASTAVCNDLNDLIGDLEAWTYDEAYEEDRW
jgi:hypothetical protein